MKKDLLKRLLISATVGVVITLTLFVGAFGSVQASSTTNVSDSKQQLVDIVLRPKSQKTLHKFVYDSVNPNSSSYRKFVTRGLFPNGLVKAQVKSRP